MQILPRSNYKHAVKEWEYRLILDHHKELSLKQVADVLGRNYVTMQKVAKRLKIKFKKQLFITGNEVLPDVEEYKQLYKK